MSDDVESQQEPLGVPAVGQPLAYAPLVPAEIPVGYSPTIAPSTLVIGISKDKGLYTFLLRPLDSLLLEEASKQIEAVRTIIPDTVAAANQKKRGMATAVLTMQAALEARAYRILSERYHDQPDALKDMPFISMWKRIGTKIGQDATFNRDRKQRKRAIKDIKALYGKRNLVAHYTTTASFDQDMQELERLIEAGRAHMQTTAALVVDLCSPE